MLNAAAATHVSLVDFNSRIGRDQKRRESVYMQLRHVWIKSRDLTRMHLCMRKHFALICSNFYDICWEKRPGREARSVSLSVRVCFFFLIIRTCALFWWKIFFFSLLMLVCGYKCIRQPPSNACRIENVCEALFSTFNLIMNALIWSARCGWTKEYKKLVANFSIFLQQQQQREQNWTHSHRLWYVHTNINLLHCPSFNLSFDVGSRQSAH